ncbi:hypothetical protein ACFPRL_25590 [Pseudoclavibacter helvolus]
MAAAFRLGSSRGATWVRRISTIPCRLAASSASTTRLPKWFPCSSPARAAWQRMPPMTTSKCTTTAPLCPCDPMAALRSSGYRGECYDGHKRPQLRGHRKTGGGGRGSRRARG